MIDCLHSKMVSLEINLHVGGASCLVGGRSLGRRQVKKIVFVTQVILNSFSLLYNTLELTVFYKLEPRHNHTFWKTVMRPV